MRGHTIIMDKKHQILIILYLLTLAFNSNYIFCFLCGMCKIIYYNDVPQSFLFLEPPGELLKAPMSKLCPRPINPESLEEGPQHQHFQNFPYVIATCSPNSWSFLLVGM